MTNEWTIYRKTSGSTIPLIENIKELEYHGEWMGDEYVTVTMKTPEPIDFKYGDYLVYRGEMFVIDYDPNVVKKAARGSYGEGFTYDNIKLFSNAAKMKSVDFKDVVLYDRGFSYTRLSEFSFFASSVEDLADRIQANLNRESDLWRVLTPDVIRCNQRGIDTSDWSRYYTSSSTKGETDVNVEVAKEDTCWSALGFAYTKFGLEFYVRDRLIVIGGDPVQVNTGDGSIFRYGKGTGLYEIERTSDEDQEVVTKLFAYGSEKNLPLNYYANIGKKIKFTISRKSKKTFITGHPTLYLWVESAAWNSALNNAFSPDYLPTLTCNGRSAVFHVSGSDTVYYDNGSTVQLDKKYLYFYWIMYGEQEVQNFYDNISVGDSVYVTGVSVNAMPSDYIELPQDYDYPTLLSVNRLMLPGFPSQSLSDWVQWQVDNTTGTEHNQWVAIKNKYDFSTDKHEPWIQSKNKAVIGLREGNVTYDGQTQNEIYPTLEGSAAGVVSVGSDIRDNGYIGDKADTSFQIKVPVVSGFDWKILYNERFQGEEMCLEMKSGYCTGRTFKVLSTPTKDSSNSSMWVLKLDRQKDGDRYFPYFDNDTSRYCQVLQGDTFVVTGIQMPDAYIQEASKRLFIAACGYLDRRDHMRYTYIPKIDELFMQRNRDEKGDLSYYKTIRPGMKLQFEDSDLGIERYDGNGNTSPFIDQLTVKENGNNGIPTYDVVLRDEKEKGTLERMSETLSDIQSATKDATERQTHPTRDKTYDKWDRNTLYYYQTLNPEPDSVTGIVYIETSYVWHNGKLWMCLRTFTTEEPKFGCKDWKCVSVGLDSDFKMIFCDNLLYPYGDIITQYPGSVDLYVIPVVNFGSEDISSAVTKWLWKKYLVNSQGTPVEEVQWRKVSRNVHITDADMPSAWGRLNPVIFTCTATIPDVDVEIEASLKLG